MMHLVWKRPDGFFDASPEDFKVHRFDDGIGLWLHRKDKDTFPFRIAGGWQETKATQRLNNLVNLLPENEEAFTAYLVETYNRSMNEDPEAFWQEINAWLLDLSQNIKGDQWEVSLVTQVFQVLQKRHHKIKAAFLQKVAGQ